MKYLTIFAAALLLALPTFGAEPAEDSAPYKKQKTGAVREELQAHVKIYGFIRNYMAFDTRESVRGTGNLFYYIPNDHDYNDYGEDLNKQTSFRFLSLTTRLGVDVVGYQFGRTKFGAKIETDFYSGLTGSTGTATLRLRQAYLTVSWDDLNEGKTSVNLKIGQAWHPLAADQPFVIGLENGTPFNAFSRTPQLLMDANLGKHFTISAAAVWQMQYTSMGISAYSDDSWTWSKSADYLKYGCMPEWYAGFSYKADSGFMIKTGLSILSIKPRRLGTDSKGVEVKVSDRITTVNPFIYLQYGGKNWQIKAKTIYSQAGEHMNLMSGYGICDASASDGHYEYTPLQTSTTFLSGTYGKKWQVMFLLGYIKNLGTIDKLINEDGVANSSAFCFSSNGYKNLNQVWRAQPAICYNAGKFTLALEYNLTSVEYGDGETYNAYGLSRNGLHWVTNHRIQTMVKFTF